jgi:hypothetical protein
VDASERWQLVAATAPTRGVVLVVVFGGRDCTVGPLLPAAGVVVTGSGGGSYRGRDSGVVFAVDEVAPGSVRAVAWRREREIVIFLFYYRNLTFENFFVFF